MLLISEEAGAAVAAAAAAAAAGAELMEGNNIAKSYGEPTLVGIWREAKPFERRRSSPKLGLVGPAPRL